MRCVSVWSASPERRCSRCLKPPTAASLENKRGSSKWGRTRPCSIISYTLTFCHWHNYRRLGKGREVAQRRRSRPPLLREKTAVWESLTFVFIHKRIKFSLMKTKPRYYFFLKMFTRELSNGLYISLLFFNFMPKQSTRVAGDTAEFGLCEIYRTNRSDNSYLKPRVFTPQIQRKCSRTLRLCRGVRHRLDRDRSFWLINVTLF